VYRKRFRHSREHALHRLAWMLHGRPPGGAWTEKLLTLTLPHSGDVGRDVATLPKAWRVFWKLTRIHLEIDRGLSKAHVTQVVYLRVIEITAGQKDDGHAHMHVYLICPYLYSALLRLHWAKAIESCGYEIRTRSAPTPLADVLASVKEDWRRAELQRLLVTRRNGEPILEVPNPVIDIVKCYAGIEHEIIKYLVKDAERDGNGVLVFDDDFLARVYEATEGFRMIQTSRGFWVPIASKTCTCESCGSTKIARKIEPAQPVDEHDPIWSAMDLPPEQWRQNK